MFILGFAIAVALLVYSPRLFKLFVVALIIYGVCHYRRLDSIVLDPDFNIILGAMLGFGVVYTNRIIIRAFKGNKPQFKEINVVAGTVVEKDSYDHYITTSTATHNQFTKTINVTSRTDTITTDTVYVENYFDGQIVPITGAFTGHRADKGDTVMAAGEEGRKDFLFINATRMKHYHPDILTGKHLVVGLMLVKFIPVVSEFLLFSFLVGLTLAPNRMSSSVCTSSTSIERGHVGYALFYHLFFWFLGYSYLLSTRDGYGMAFAIYYIPTFIMTIIHTKIWSNDYLYFVEFLRESIFAKYQEKVDRDTARIEAKIKARAEAEANA
ncbi:hypothetical protein ACI2KR_08935 [Pseudomonas luteola]